MQVIPYARPSLKPLPSKETGVRMFAVAAYALAATMYVLYVRRILREMHAPKAGETS